MGNINASWKDYLLHCVLNKPIVLQQFLENCLAHFSLLWSWCTSKVIKTDVEPFIDFLMNCMIPIKPQFTIIHMTKTCKQEFIITCTQKHPWQQSMSKKISINSSSHIQTMCSVIISSLTSINPASRGVSMDQFIYFYWRLGIDRLP